MHNIVLPTCAWEPRESRWEPLLWQPTPRTPASSAAPDTPPGWSCDTASADTAGLPFVPNLQSPSPSPSAGTSERDRLRDLNKSEWLKVCPDDLKFCFVLKTGLWRHTKSHNELLLSLLCRVSFHKSPDLSKQLQGVQWKPCSFILPLSRGQNTKKKSGKYIPRPCWQSWIMQQENLTKS